MPIVAMISQTNLIGESDLSQEGGGASIFVPVVPDSPVNLQPVASEITKTQLKFTWSDGTYNGGKAILDYKVEYD